MRTPHDKDGQVVLKGWPTEDFPLDLDPPFPGQLVVPPYVYRTLSVVVGDDGRTARTLTVDKDGDIQGKYKVIGVDGTVAGVNASHELQVHSEPLTRVQNDQQIGSGYHLGVVDYAHGHINDMESLEVDAPNTFSSTQSFTKTSKRIAVQSTTSDAYVKFERPDGTIVGKSYIPADTGRTYRLQANGIQVQEATTDGGAYVYVDVFYHRDMTV